MVDPAVLENMKEIANVFKGQLGKLEYLLNELDMQYRIYQQNIENIIAIFDDVQHRYYKSYSNCVKEKNKEECKKFQDVIDGLEMVKRRMKELYCGFNAPSDTVISILKTFHIE